METPERSRRGTTVLMSCLKFEMENGTFFMVVILECIREVGVTVRNVCGRLLTCRSDKSIASMHQQFRLYTNLLSLALSLKI